MEKEGVLSTTDDKSYIYGDSFPIVQEKSSATNLTQAMGPISVNNMQRNVNKDATDTQERAKT